MVVDMSTDADYAIFTYALLYLFMLHTLYISPLLALGVTTAPEGQDQDRIRCTGPMPMWTADVTAGVVRYVDRHRIGRKLLAVFYIGLHRL